MQRVLGNTTVLGQNYVLFDDSSTYINEKFKGSCAVAASTGHVQNKLGSNCIPF